ncbi:DUF7673 family protein [Xanthomonas massiliensis]|uniref:DUF7673 family protein n=1 Tax=Xanthomonas massiliensis TaxID=1720302 RepID=UPI0008259230|nr:hypothetical protein [Xanthomonas massiliensis]
MTELDPQTRAALDRLLEVASHDTGQSRRCADFLLSWWNAESCGGFDPTDLWSVDLQIKRDMVRMLSFIALNPYYPDALGFRTEFEALVEQWRPQLCQPKPH